MIFGVFLQRIEGIMILWVKILSTEPLSASTGTGRVTVNLLTILWLRQP